MKINLLIKNITINIISFTINILTSIIPIKNDLVLFESFFGASINDNPLAIYNFIEDLDYKKIFLVNKPKLYPEYKTIKRNTIKSYYYLRIAKIIVTNQRMPKYWKKRKNQIYLQTWHGTPLKKLAFDLNSMNMPSANSLEEYQSMFKDDVDKWDYLISSCAYTTKCFQSSFKYQGDILEIGYPRNYKLYNQNKYNLNSIKERLNIPLDKKIILYAPTYREDSNYGLGKYLFECMLDFSLFANKMPEYIILTRFHYSITKKNVIDNNNVIDVSDYYDINDLYLISDVLVSDYSSVFFDYAILNKPFYFFTYDLEHYKDDLRGFYLDIEKDLNKKLIKDNITLIDCINENNYYNINTFNQKYNPQTNSNVKNEIVRLFKELQKHTTN